MSASCKQPEKPMLKPPQLAHIALQNMHAGSQPSWTIKMLFDGACPLCMREVNSLRKAKGASNINFVDVAADDYDPYQHANIGFEEVRHVINVSSVAACCKECVSAWQLPCWMSIFGAYAGHG